MRNFFRSIFLALIIFVFVFISACSPAIPPLTATKLPPATETIAPSPTGTTLPTVTTEPTAQPAATPIPREQLMIRQIYENYGYVDESKLSANYWQTLYSRLDKYGKATSILTLEYHGDSYDMYDGHYAMDPVQFEVQMRYLLANDYHFVTGPELVGYLQGWLALPTRSVILTTDSGPGSIRSFERILPLFKSLENEYGYAPHFLSFIWTMGMDASFDACAGDICWESFRQALRTGYFSFGSHTQTHRDMGSLSRKELRFDLQTSMDAIHNNLGLSVFGLSWPLESCPVHTDLLSDMGFIYAFGGNVKAENFTFSGDSQPLCLPRLFPPNPDGLSGRPGGLTLEEMLNLPLKAISP